MREAVYRYAKALHHSIPYCIRRVYLPLISSIGLIRSFYLRLYSIYGEEYSSGTHLRFAYLGLDERILSYYTSRLFKNKVQVKREEVIPVWHAYKYFKSRSGQYDLVIIEINRFTRKHIRFESGFLLPRWLETQLIVRDSLKILSKGDVARRIRKYALTCVKSKTIEDFALFYDRMYKPYISSRHKDAAVVADYKYFHNIFRNKGTQMYFILQDGEPVAGSIDEIRYDKIRMSGLGILDGRDDLKRKGVIGALYYFQVLDYSLRNITSVLLGGTSPILTDGLTQYKLSVGAEAADKQYIGDQFLWLLPLGDTAAVRGVLKSNPFISIVKDDLYRNIFVEAENENDESSFMRFYDQTKCNNIHSTRVFCFNSSELISEWIKNSGLQAVEVFEFNL